MRLPIYWRILALLALGAFIGFVITLFKLVLGNVILLIVASLSITGVIYGAWLILTGKGKRLRLGWILLAISAGVVVLELVYLLTRHQHSWLIVLTIILVGLYILLLNMLRNTYWRAVRSQVVEEQKTAKFQHPVLIINPKSGNGRAIKNKVDKIAARRGVKVTITRKQDNITELAQAAVKDGADVIGVSGGDGTLGAVAKVALANNLPLVVLPGGTRCHFARDIGLDPKRIVDALEGFHGVEREISVGLINDRVFLNNASFGAYADIVDKPQYRDNKAAVSRQVLRDLLSGKQPAYSLRYRDNNQKNYSRAILVLIGVNPYNTMHLLELGHRDALDTGKLQITIVSKLNDSTIRQLLGTLTFKKNPSIGSAQNIGQWTTDTFSISGPNKSLVAGVDGERENYTSPVKMRIAPQKLRLMIPAEGVRPRPKSPFNKDVFHYLWRIVIGR